METKDLRNQAELENPNGFDTEAKTLLWALLESGEYSDTDLEYCVKAMGILRCNTEMWNVFMCKVNHIKTYTDINKWLDLRKHMNKIQFAVYVLPDLKIQNWHAEFVRQFKSIQSQLNNDITPNNWENIQIDIQRITNLVNPDIEKLKKVLSAFKSLVYDSQNKPIRDYLNYTETKWNDLKMRFEMLISVKYQLEILAHQDQDSKWFGKYSNWMNIENCFKSDPEQYPWQCIVDVLYTLCRFEENQNPELIRAIHKASSVIGAEPNHEYIEIANQMISEL